MKVDMVAKPPWFLSAVAAGNVRYDPPMQVAEQMVVGARSATDDEEIGARHSHRDRSGKRFGEVTHPVSHARNPDLNLGGEGRGQPSTGGAHTHAAGISPRRPRKVEAPAPEIHRCAFQPASRAAMTLRGLSSR